MKKQIQFIAVLFFSFTVHCYAEEISTDSLAALMNSTKHDTIKGEVLMKISDQILYAAPDSSFKMAQKAFQFFISYDVPDKLYWTYRNIGYYFQNTFQPDSARYYFNKCLDIAKELESKMYIAQSNGSIGNTYYHEERFDKSLEYFNEAMSIFRELGSKRGEATAHAVIGNVYSLIGDDTNALVSYNFAKELFEEIGSEHNLALSLMNIGLIYKRQKKYDLAEKNLYRALELFIKHDSKVGLGQSYSSLGVIYMETGDFEKSLEYQEKSLPYFKEANATKDHVTSLINLATSSDSLGETNNAKDYCLSALKIAEEKDYIELQVGLNEYLYYLYKKSGVYDDALHYMEKYKELDDTLAELRNKEALSEQLVKYQTENKNIEIELLKKDQEVKQAKLKRRNILMIFGAAVIFLSILLIFLQYRNIRRRIAANRLLQKQKEEILEQQEHILEQNEELKQQKAEIEAQREEIEIQRDYVTEQRDQIAEKNSQINQSIKYASNIQYGILQPEKFSKHLTKEYFVFYRPKDVVSGDFYWARKINNKTVIAVADCTGHGVPGAFMSLMGIAFLNNIVMRVSELKPGAIINELKKELLQSLQKPENRDYPLDGMDISVCIIDDDSSKLLFNGVNLPLIAVNNKMQEIHTAEKGPAGIYHFSEGIEDQEINMEKETYLYLFSDGFFDQFGGNHNRKYGVKRLKQFFLENHTFPLSEQKILLEKQFENWKGNQYQVDDVLVFGMLYK